MKTTTALVLLIACLLPLDAVHAQNGYDLFQQALTKERTDGDLRGAIELYDKIANASTSDRDLAARALVQMAHSYSRLGENEDARRTYRSALSRFGDHPFVKASVPAEFAPRNVPPTDQPMEGIVIRKIEIDSRSIDPTASPSADGRLLAMVDWKTGDLAVFDLEKNSLRRVTNKGEWHESHAFAMFPIFAPEQERIAYTWYTDDHDAELRIVGLDGAGVRTLFRIDATSGWVGPAAWTPDGRSILAEIDSKSDDGERRYRLAFIDITDGTLRVVHEAGSSLSPYPSLSPDGKFIAFDQGAEDSDGSRDVLILRSDGADEPVRLIHPAEDRMPVWTPDGSGFVFVSDRSGTNDVWFQAVEDGRAVGKPRLVTASVGRIMPMGFTADGALYFVRQIGNQDIYLADFDPQTGDVRGRPRQLSQRYVGSNSRPLWFDAGNRVVYLSKRSFDPISGSQIVVVRDLTTGDERDIETDLASMMGSAEMLPDGCCLIVRAQDANRSRAFYQVDLASGETRTLIPSSMDRLERAAQITPDAKSLYFIATHLKERQNRIIRRDIRSGEESVIHEVQSGPDISDLDLSPDGRRLAYLEVSRPDKPKLMVVPVDGGEPSLIGVLDHYSRHLGWSPDGRYIYYRQGEDERLLWRIPADGGQSEQIDLGMTRIQSFSIHPDGRQIVFSAGENQDEIWVMEGAFDDKSTE